jgi:two-component system response regulator (stage 0 sporulation protein F)
LAESGQTLTVLVVDDQPGVRSLLQTVLSDAGYRVALAADGRSALAAAASARPDVVLVDQRLPGLSGLEVLAALPDIVPMAIGVLMSASGESDLADAARRCGAQAVIAKPFDVGAVVRLIQSLTAGRVSRTSPR